MWPEGDVSLGTGSGGGVSKHRWLAQVVEKLKTLHAQVEPPAILDKLKQFEIGLGGSDSSYAGSDNSSSTPFISTNNKNTDNAESDMLLCESSLIMPNETIRDDNDKELFNNKEGNKVREMGEVVARKTGRYNDIPTQHTLGGMQSGSTKDIPLVRDQVRTDSGRATNSPMTNNLWD